MNQTNNSGAPVEPQKVEKVEIVDQKEAPVAKYIVSVKGDPKRSVEVEGQFKSTHAAKLEAAKKLGVKPEDVRKLHGERQVVKAPKAKKEPKAKAEKKPKAVKAAAAPSTSGQGIKATA